MMSSVRGRVTAPRAVSFNRGSFHRVSAWLALALFVLSCGQVTDAPEPAATSRDLSALPDPSAKPSTSSVPASLADPARATVWVSMRQVAPLARAATVRNWKTRGEVVTNDLQATAATSQASLQAFLASRKIPFKSFWIVNSLKVSAERSVIEEIARRPDVARIVPDGVFQIPPIQRGSKPPQIQEAEWGLHNIRAPEVWDTFGVRGEGIVVANIDTGVELSHSALVNQYRGNAGGSFDHSYNWFDPTGICGSPENGPCDNAQHGTHTMGTMVGDDLAGNQIGVAPQARWIAAKGCEDLFCSFDALMSSGQWLLAPTDVNGQNPRPDLRPNIINNSWSGGPADPFFQGIVQAWVAAGIFPAFAASNAGPFCGSTGSPGDYPESYAMGAYDINNVIAEFSSRGPSLFDGAIKPDISAPGVDVRSAVPGNGYDFFSGTSMATPHVAGSVALLWSAAPSLIGDVASTRELLDQTAIDTPDFSCGGDEDDNAVYGEGRVDIFSAVEQAPRGPTGILAGTVTSSAGRPIAGARVRAEGDTVRDALTDASGSFRMVLSVGSYQVAVSAFGYRPRTAALFVSEGETIVQRFPLRAAPSFRVSGSVTDNDGNAIANASVTIAGTPLPPAVTDARGIYSFPRVPEGVYDVTAAPGGCFQSETASLSVDSAEVLDFVVEPRVDGFGYSCKPAEFAYIEANTVLPLSGDDSAISVPLPFEFPFYGQLYSSVEVATNGYVNLGTPLGFSPFFNTSIPEINPPNAAIYALWDDLVVDIGSSVRTETLGDAPNRQFVIEWRDVPFLADFGLLTRFEIVLHEDGRILMQYHTADPDPMQRGNSATVGLENESGTDALQFSFNTESLASGLAVLYDFPPSGFVRGRVLEANDPERGVAGAAVEALSGDVVVRSARSGADGQFSMQVPVGDYVLRASKSNYDTEVAFISVAEGDFVDVDFQLRTGRLELSSASLQLTVLANETRRRQLLLSNTGTRALSYSINEAGGARQRGGVGTVLGARRALPANRSALDTRGLFGAGAAAAGWTAALPGEVIRSFVPSGVELAWGVGYTGNLWLGDFFALLNDEFTSDGAATGRSWPAPWAGVAAGDMAYDPSRHLMCQVAIEGGNGIHCWDPDTGEVVQAITGSFPWTQISQRGLAYRPDDDSFYIGGWNEGILYHVRGLSDPNPGEVISSCSPPDPSISGLAWNDSVQVLWVATNSPTDTIYELNPDDCTVLATLAHPAPGFSGAGLELDELGNLWMIAQARNEVFLVESGVPAFSDVPWLSVIPVSGSIAPGESHELAVTVDTAGLVPGAYLASLFVLNDAGLGERVRIPVSLLVPAYQQGVDAGSTVSYVDALGDPWAADQAHVSGSFGYLQDIGVAVTDQSIAGTDDAVLYQSQRLDPYAYRFDNVPSGVYQVELRFAELSAGGFGERLFDVIIENTEVLPSHDIVYESGVLTADDWTFFVPVTDGRVDIRFVPRTGFREPVINALRVTHRSDR